MVTKSGEQWEERFGGPLQNAEGSSFFETYGVDMDVVQSADPLTVWTIIEGDESENQYLLPGFRIVNCLGYVLAENPITQAELASGEWDEVLWFDGNDIDCSSNPIPG